LVAAALNGDGSVTIERIGAASSYRLDFSYVAEPGEEGSVVENTVTVTTAQGKVAEGVYGVHIMAAASAAAAPQASGETDGATEAASSEAPLTSVVPLATTASGGTQSIGDGETPLAAFVSTSTWSGLNLVLAVITGILAIVVWALYFLRRRADAKADSLDASQVAKRSLVWSALSLAVAVIASALFVLTEDTSLTMGVADEWTAVHVTILLLQLGLAAMALYRPKVVESTVEGAEGPVAGSVAGSVAGAQAAKTPAESY
jgi:uncharacterized membrane protein